MNLRLAMHNDIEAISSLYTEFYKYNAEQQPDYYVAAEEDGNYPQSVIDSNSGDILVAEVDGCIVGFIHIEEESTPPYPSVAPHRFACIVDLIVTQSSRRNGIGQLLLEDAKRWAKSRELEYLELTVLENNEIGRSFYEHKHFLRVSRTMRLKMEK
jgi:ribosomal protein S18 acetylase RimI-like enzyme